MPRRQRQQTLLQCLPRGHGAGVIAFNARCVLEKKGSMRTVSIAELFTGNGVAPFAIGAMNCSQDPHP